MEITQADVTSAVQAALRRPDDVLALAIEAADIDDFVDLLVARLGLPRQQAMVVVDIPFRRFNQDARAGYE